MTDGSIEALLHATASTEDESQQWLQSFEQQSLWTFRVSKTYPDVGLKLLFKVTSTVSTVVQYTLVCMTTVKVTFTDNTEQKRLPMLDYRA